VLITGTGPAQLFDPVSAGLTSAGALPTARTAPAIAQLDDGRVVTAGGRISLTVSAATDLYNPAANSWSAGPALAVARLDHTLTALIDGGAMAIGGGANTALASTERYDPATNNWITGANLVTARYQHTATRLANGAVLVHGGRSLLDAFAGSELLAMRAGAPRNIGTLPGNGQVTLSFDPPAADGGAAITGYTATCTSLGRPALSGTAATSPIIVGGLVNYVGYGCVVVATNAQGDSPSSAPVFVTPVDPPVIGNTLPMTGKVGLAFDNFIFSNPAATSYGVIGNLPPGLSLNTGTGRISGTPTQAGAFNVTFTASNGAGTGSAMLTITIAAEVLVFNGAVSRKTHGTAGTYDIAIARDVPLGGAVTVEPRAIGSGHLLVFQFDYGIFGLANITATDANSQDVGTITSAINGNTLEVTLSNVPDRTRVTVTANDLNYTTTAVATIAFMQGDVNNSRSTTSADASALKARAGQPVNADNFRFDLNTTGIISAADIAGLKARSFAVLP